MRRVQTRGEFEQRVKDLLSAFNAEKSDEGRERMVRAVAELAGVVPYGNEDAA